MICRGDLYAVPGETTRWESSFIFVLLVRRECAIGWSRNAASLKKVFFFGVVLFSSVVCIRIGLILRREKGNCTVVEVSFKIFKKIMVLKWKFNKF